MMLPSIQVGLQTLRANPFRTLLSTLGIVMGAASLVGVLSAGDGAFALARRQIQRFGLQSVGVMPKTVDIVDGLSIPRSTYPTFSIEQARSLSAHLGAGSAVALSAAGGVGTFVKSTGGPPRAAAVLGAYGSFEALLGGVPIAHGRFLTEDEMAGAGTVVVISGNLAQELAAGKSPVSVLNTRLLLQGRPWTIVGVLEDTGNGRTFTIIVPIGAFPLAAASQGQGPSRFAGVRSLLVLAPRIEDVLSVQSQVEAWADATEPTWRKDSLVTISSQGAERLRQLNQGMLIFKLLMGSFAAISLVVGGIGIMNVLLAAVAERTREIGVRKAAGATRRDIVVQFLSESVVISLAGSMLGAVVGLSAAVGITAFIRWRTSTPMYAMFTWQTFAISMGTAIAVGLIFGVYPALKAAGLSPVDAMRYE
jgi:putative ABC transport system permease protein